MLAQLRRLHAQVREAIARNAQATARLLQCVVSPRPVRVSCNGSPHARMSTELITYQWNGKRWERRVLADGEE